MAPSVSVPVLSVNSTSMLPRSSIVTSRLTSTLLAGELARAGREAHADDRRQQLRGDADRDREREQQRVDQRPRERDVDDEDRDGQDAGDPDEQLARSSRRPTWNAVSACRSPEPDGDLAERGRRARSTTTTPRPEPWCTTVPMKAHDGRSTAESRLATARPTCAAGIDSPVSTASSHSSCVDLEQAHVGGDDVADAQRDDVAGHEVAHVDAPLGAVAPDERLVADVGVQRGDGALGAVLVDEAEPDAEHDDRGDDRRRRSGRRSRRTRRRRQQQDEQRVAQLADEDAERGDLRVRPGRCVRTPPAARPPRPTSSPSATSRAGPAPR